MTDPWSMLHRFRTDWRFLGPLLAVHAVVIPYGWYYYWRVGQFDPDSPLHVSVAWWPLVADSPHAVLLLTIALLLSKVHGWRHPALDGAAFVLNVYVGIWTTFLFLTYPDRMHTWDWGGTNNILFLAHFGMPLQALVLVHDLRHDARRAWPWVPWLLAALALYIAVDYWGPHLHPGPFLHPDDGALHAWAPWLMAASVAAWIAVLAWPRRAEPGTPPDAS